MFAWQWAWAWVTGSPRSVPSFTPGQLLIICFITIVCFILSHPRLPFSLILKSNLSTHGKCCTDITPTLQSMYTASILLIKCLLMLTMSPVAPVAPNPAHQWATRCCNHNQAADICVHHPSQTGNMPYAHQLGLSFVPSLHLLHPNFEPHCLSNWPTGDRTTWTSFLTPWPSCSRAGCCLPSQKKVRCQSAKRESTATACDADLMLVQGDCTRKACRCSLVSAFCSPCNLPDGLTQLIMHVWLVSPGGFQSQ